MSKKPKSPKGAKPGKGLDLVSMRDSATSTFNAFTIGQKTTLVLAAVGVVVGALFLTKASSSKDWATLYGNLPTDQAASVTQELSAQGVSYRLSAGGSAIEVPKASVYQTRMDLSAKNLPADGNPGYSLLDKQGITASEFRQRLDYQRALEGELAKTVRSINGVDAANVHLVVPKEDLFTDDARKPSASVLLISRSGDRLTSGQVRAVVHLVASSVEGLSPDDVTVADSSGRVLSSAGDSSIDSGDARADQTKAYEDSMSASLLDMVEQVTGVGHASVRVKADLNYDIRSVVTESFNDNNGKPVATTERLSSEAFTGPAAASQAPSVAGGALSSVLATPTTVAGSTATVAGNDYKKSDTQREYAVGKVTEKLENAPGSVQRLSIAVLVDQRLKINPASLRSLVAAAAGLDTKRGDTLQLGTLPFDQSDAKVAAAELSRVETVAAKTQMFQMIRGGALALLALVTVLIGYRGAKKSTTRRMPILIDGMNGSGADPLALERRDAIALEAGAGGSLSGSGNGGLAGSDPRDRELVSMLAGQPDDVAETLRDWLGDRRA